MQAMETLRPDVMRPCQPQPCTTHANHISRHAPTDNGTAGREQESAQRQARQQSEGTQWGRQVAGAMTTGPLAEK